MAWFVVLVLLLSPKPSRWPVETLYVDGNQNYSREQILAVAGIRVGQLVGKEDFEAARDRLVATGLFEIVGYRFAPARDGKGYVASFQVTEIQPVYPVRFEGFDVPVADLDAWLKSKVALLGPKIPPSKPLLDRCVKVIEDFRKEKVTAVVTPTGADQFTIVFRPARATPAIAQVDFEGNQVPARFLLEAISGVAVGTPYSENTFRQILDSSVRPVYEARGHIRVSFPKIATEPAKDVNGLAVHVTVNEGAVYELGDVRLDGSIAVKAEELLKAAQFKSGETVNFNEIAQGVDRLKKRLRRQGYMRVDAQVKRNIDDRQKIVDLLIHINEGPRFLFGKLKIEGLDIHGEAAIKRLWSIKEGQPFNGDYPDYFLERVREAQIFETLGKTQALAEVDEATRTVDVSLRFGAASKESGATSPLPPAHPDP